MVLVDPVGLLADPAGNSAKGVVVLPRKMVLRISIGDG